MLKMDEAEQAKRALQEKITEEKVKRGELDPDEVTWCSVVSQTCPPVLTSQMGREMSSIATRSSRRSLLHLMRPDGYHNF